MTHGYAQPETEASEALGKKRLPVVNGYCVGCAKCVDVCPVDVLATVWDTAVLKDAERCTSCGRCTAVCEDDAIHMHWIPHRGDTGVGEWRQPGREPTPATAVPWWRRWAKA
jgi:2-oxoglutarate ferredoxin oxidoreductase subunit delta